MTLSPRLGAIAVVIRGREVLLVQRRNPPDSHLWGFPGGHVEWGETALHAAARELREETGVIAAPQSYLTNVDVLRVAPDGTTDVHYLLAAVLCIYESGEPVADDDAADARWWPVEDVLDGRLEMSARVTDVLTLALG